MDEFTNILNLLRLGSIVLCVLVSRISDRESVGGVDRFDACIALSCRLLARKCIGRTIKRGGIANGEGLAFVDFTSLLSQ